VALTAQKAYFPEANACLEKFLKKIFPAPCNFFLPGLSFRVLQTNHFDSSAPRFFSEKGSY
jgi:hypothetical protein